MGKRMQTGLVMWTTENQGRAITSSLTNVARHSAGWFALSSSEAKNQCMAEAVQEVLDLKQLLEVFGIQQINPIAFGEENQTSINLCQNLLKHKRSEHIETNFYFFRDKTEDGTISIHYVPTDKMAANIFMKSLPV